MEHRLEQVGHRRLADGAEDQRADGDAELVAADHQRDVLHRPQRGARQPGAGLGPRLDLGTARRDQGELRADEERVAERAAATRGGRRWRCSSTRPSGPVGRRSSDAAGATPVDAQAVHVLDGQDRELLARLVVGVGAVGHRHLGHVAGSRDPAELAEDQAGDGVVVLVLGQLDAGRGPRPRRAAAGRRATRSRRGAGGPGAAAGRARRRCRRRSPRRRPRGSRCRPWPPYSSRTTAIWKPSSRSSASSGSSRRRVGHHDRLDHEVLDPGRGPLVHRQGDGVLDVHGADDVVVVVEHREARVAGLRASSMTVAGPVGRPRRLVVRTRGRHDLAGGAGAELHRALHQLGGVGVEGALVGRALRSARRARSELRAERSSSCGSMPSAAHERVGRAVEQPDRAGSSRGEARAGSAGWRGRSPCGRAMREVLGHQLAEDHRQDGADGQADADRDRRAPRPRARRPPSAGRRSASAIAGSARKPIARLVTVMPTWAPESWVDSERSACCTPRAPASPSAGGLLDRDRSTVTKENSAATNTPQRDDQQQRPREQQPRGHRGALPAGGERGLCRGPSMGGSRVLRSAERSSPL